jgi:hypothetical protein
VSATDGSISDGGTGVFARIENRLDRIEDKLDARMNTLDAKVGLLDIKVDGVAARQDRLEGGLSMIRWLGPAGVGALVAGLAAARAGNLW